MSRPAAPAYPIRSFATDANYAAGPEDWNGQPTKVEPADIAKGFTPNTGASAEEANKLFSDAFAQDESAKDYSAELCEYVGQMQALNWPLRTAEATLLGKKSALYNAIDRKWYVFAEDHGRAISSDQGHTWSATFADPSDTYISGDHDTAGNMVIGKASRYVHRWNGSAWSDVDVYAAAFTNAARVVHDPFNGKFVWVGIGSSGIANYSASVDGTTGTWSALGSLTGNFLNNADPRFGLAVNKTIGRVAFGGVDTAGGNLRFAYSNNGGTSFTTGANQVTAIVAPTVVEMSFNAAEGAFYFVVGETSGTHMCEIWRSADGITWTKVKTITGWCLREIAGLGALLVAVAAGGDVMYSIDQGVTWRVAGLAVSGTPVGVYVGSGRPIIVTSSHLYIGLAAGLPAGVFA